MERCALAVAVCLFVSPSTRHPKRNASRAASNPAWLTVNVGVQGRNVDGGATSAVFCNCHSNSHVATAPALYCSRFPVSSELLVLPSHVCCNCETLVVLDLDRLACSRGLCVLDVITQQRHFSRSIFCRFCQSSQGQGKRKARQAKARRDSFS